MTREEAAAYLNWLPGVKHSMCRRARWHNYRQRGLYMLTLVVKGRKPLLGTLEFGPPARVKYSPLGMAIELYELPKMKLIYPMVELWMACFMPDHLHLIVYINSPLPTGRHLGHVIGGFKSGCSRRWWEMTGYEASEGETRNPLFEEGYHDRLLSDPSQLDVWKRYLDDNPRRLALKRQNPGLSTTLHQYPINGCPYNICGNRFLLDIPDKMAVIVHRRDSDEAFRAACDRWLACGERGGVLVSAAVARREKAVMRVAMERGYSIILLRENGFPKFYKPSGEAFDACAEGRLLQISPQEYRFDKGAITRGDCLRLNEIALSIAGELRD